MAGTNRLHTQILKSVARSFYLSLKILPSRIRPVMGLGYLFCRIADTIADTDVIPLQSRKTTLGTFKFLFKSFPIPEEKLKSFIQEVDYMNAAPKTAEGQLLSHLDSCVQAFKSLSRTDQSLIQAVVDAVITGMEKDLATFGSDAESLKSFSTTEDLDHYISWIGGEPGRFWTGVCLHHFKNLGVTPQAEWIHHGIQFGRGLQMVNILRDIKGDLNRGRCYIPDDKLKTHHLTPHDLLTNDKPDDFLLLYHDLLRDTLKLLSHGMDYLFLLPRTAVRLRAAVWWPLALGLMTLSKLRERDDILTQEKPTKVSRGEVYKLLLTSVVTLPSNGFLKMEFEDLSKGITSRL